MKYVKDLLGLGSDREVKAFLDSLSDNALASLPFLFEHWAHEAHQLAPDTDWSTWIVLGGRGAGKTRAGAEWVRAQVEGSTPDAPGKARRVALVAETYDQARDIMVLGESGIIACSPPDRRPKWMATTRKLVWPNGAEAQCFSASDPEALRGPQFDIAWCDELAKWKKADETWDMLQFCLRLGDHPRQVVTTTPRPTPLLRRLLDDERTVRTSAPTEANRLYLADGFLENITARYRGTRQGRQELNGELLTDMEGAFWTYDQLDLIRVTQAPPLNRIVVAVDPPVTSGQNSDTCGIVVAGVEQVGETPNTWQAYVIEDASVSGRTPLEWAERAVAKLREYEADRLIAEVNQGGELVESVVRQIDPMIPMRSVNATRAKGARAEPVAALYEQGRVFHVGTFAEMEDQMTQMSLAGFGGRGSPDRVDALVWALHELILKPAASHRAPRVRSL